MEIDLLTESHSFISIFIYLYNQASCEGLLTLTLKHTLVLGTESQRTVYDDDDFY